MDLARHLRHAVVVEQQQQVDIGVREQLPPAVAAHGEQGKSRGQRRQQAAAAAQTVSSTYAVRSASTRPPSPVCEEVVRMRSQAVLEG